MRAVVRGRDFDERDNEPALPVAVINQTMAQRFWPGEDAVGKRFRLDSTNNAKPWMTVVGIIHDAEAVEFGRHAADEEMYIPFLQDADYLHNKSEFPVHDRRGAHSRPRLRARAGGARTNSDD